MFISFDFLAGKVNWDNDPGFPARVYYNNDHYEDGIIRLNSYEIPFKEIVDERDHVVQVDIANQFLVFDNPNTGSSLEVLTLELSNLSFDNNKKGDRIMEGDISWRYDSVFGVQSQPEGHFKFNFATGIMTIKTINNVQKRHKWK